MAEAEARRTNQRDVAGLPEPEIRAGTILNDIENVF
jgi:hypothetical protein